jgi:putative flippase GtrA
MQIILKYLDHKIVKYGIIGAISTLIHISTAYTYIYLINNSVFYSNIIGFLFAFSFSYIFQSKLVFKHAISYIKAFKYFIVQFMSLLVAIVISDYVPLGNSYLKVILVVVILPLITYVVHNIWTFSEVKN